ncbi:MAG: hypothetical protein V7K67_30300 [Nostoc sp.]
MYKIGQHILPFLRPRRYTLYPFIQEDQEFTQNKCAISLSTFKANSPSLPLPTSFDGYKSKSRLNVSTSESSSSSSANGVAVLEESFLSSVLIGVKATCCVGNAPFLKAK